MKKQINEWLRLGCIVPSDGPYGHTVLFAEKKGGGGLCLYVNYPILYYPFHSIMRMVEQPSASPTAQ